MAKIPVSCPNCQTQYQVDDSHLGKKAVCTHCKTSFILSPPEEVASTWHSPWPWVSRGSSVITSSVRTAPADGNRQPTEDAVPEIWQPGDVILDLYEVREVFTSGGRGLVYRVRHRGWNMDLAVKCPRPEYFRNEQDKEIFEQEAETWVKLGLHPHTTNCYYVRRLGGIPRVFAEYVTGGSLSEWIRTGKFYTRGPRIALERILDVAIQFAWGLQHAHDQGLVHRDVKPGNVLMTAEGIAKVTDFGMAKARGIPTEVPRGEESRSVMVSSGGMTPAFCSPEQLQGQPVSRKTDIWSWGLSVLAMFAGAANWSAGYLAAGALQAYLNQGPADERLPPMPPVLIELLKRCFRPDPEARPKDMREIVTVLQELYREATGSAYQREAPLPAKALADSLNNRAVSLRDLNKHAEAEQLWEEALAAGPNHPEATYNLGLSRWRDGRVTFEAVLQKMQEVCTTHPGEWLPLYLLAQVYVEQGSWQAAIATLEKIKGAGADLDEVRAAMAVAQERLANPTRFVHRFQGHTDWVSSVCASADGRYLLSGSADRTLKLWEVSTGQCLRTFQGHREWVTSVCLSADGLLALSGSADKTLKLWQVATGLCLRTLVGHTNWVLAVALSADGRHALSGDGDSSLRLWDLGLGKCLRTFEGHRGPVLSVSLSADGRWALSGSRDTTLKVWEVDSGQCVRTFTGHSDKVHAAVLSLDGQYALSGSGDRTLKWWEVATGRCLRTLEGHAGGVLAVTLSADGRRAISGGGDRIVKFWRLGLGQALCTLEGHTGTVNSVCLSGDKRYVVSGSGDKTLILWSLPNDVLAPYLVSRVLPSETALAAWTDYEQALMQARRCAAAGDAVRAAQWIREARSQPGYGRRPEAMKEWSGLYVRLARKTLQGGWERHTWAEHLDAVTAVCWSRRGRLALSGSADRTLKLWDAATGRCLGTWEGHFSVVTAVCLSADDRYALSGCADTTLKLWETATGQCLRTFQGHTDVITSASLTADGRHVLSGSMDGTLKLWETATGRCLRTFAGHTDPIHSVCLTADGRHALSGGAQFLIRNENERLFTSGQLKLWETATGRCLPTFLGHTEAVTSVSLSSDGRYALSGGGQSVIQHQTGRFAQSGQFQLWEVRTGRQLGTFTGHADAVTSVCLSVDGRYALSGSTDRTLKLWEAATGQCLRTFAGHLDAVTSVALSADGRYALSGSADRTLKLWILDWELEDNQPADWNEGARPYLEMFLSLHTPYAAQLPQDRKRTMKDIVNSSLARLFKAGPTEEDIAQALTRRGRPFWTEEDFEDLLYTLGCAGYGWLRPEGVRRQLEQMSRKWPGSLTPP
jgi:predicted Zn finger-like uncharacterized protein